MDAARYTAAAVETATGTRPEIFAFGWMDYYPPNVRGQKTVLPSFVLEKIAELAKRLVFPFRRSIPAHSRLLVRVTAAGQPADGPVPERRGRGAGVRPAGAVGRRRHHRLGRLGGHLQQHAVQRTEVARAQTQPVVSLTTHDYRHSI